MPTLFTCVVYSTTWQGGLIQYNLTHIRIIIKIYSFVLGSFYNVLICNMLFISNRIINVYIYICISILARIDVAKVTGQHHPTWLFLQ